ncbi:MAG TPA: tripartite tricarboxylate transporter substrate binding protein [Casimicrobiaceae bacterium]|jgi:tripartite-type tricarboxylate transporter receptor subunit TctC
MFGKRAVMLLLGAFVLAAHGATALAQRFPTKPLTLVVGFAPGGGVDINARLLAAKLAEYLGQPVIVENRPGAGSKIASERVANAAPDGHTLLIATAAVAIDMAFYEKVRVDTLRDFAPVSTISSTPMILVVNPSVPVKDVRELVAHARTMPGTLNYSSSGSGTTGQLYGELFKLRTGTDIVHIPYKGTAPSLTALIAGEVDMSFATVPAVLQYIRAGRLRPLASTGEKRSELMPDVPTMKEAGVSGVVASVWYGVFAPAATPPDIVNILARAVMDASHSPDVRQRLLDLGAEPVATTPEEFGRLLQEEVAKWTALVKAAGIRAD